MPSTVGANSGASNCWGKFWGLHVLPRALHPWQDMGQHSSTVPCPLLWWQWFGRCTAGFGAQSTAVGTRDWIILMPLQMQHSPCPSQCKTVGRAQHQEFHWDWGWQLLWKPWGAALQNSLFGRCCSEHIYHRNLAPGREFWEAGTCWRLSQG